MVESRTERSSMKESQVVAREASSAGGRPNPATRWNADYFEAAYRDWRENPDSVSDEWRQFFQGFELGLGRPAGAPGIVAAEDQSHVASLIFAYRNIGYRVARSDPLAPDPGEHPDLGLENFGLTERDLDREFDTGHLHMAQRAPLREIIEVLKQTYCGHIGVEYLHIQDVHKRRWLQAEMELVRNKPSFSHARKMEILEKLIDAEVFERFIHTRYVGQKRFSLEGAETIIPAVHALVELAPEHGVEEIVLGMAHRGRLNVLANVMNKSYAMIFCEFEGGCLASTPGGSGDVKYHLGYTSDHISRNGNRVHLTLTPNPSHLEAVNPVVEGRVRAKQRQRGDVEKRQSVVPVLIHGDAAFAGQGLVAETLNLSKLRGYRTGGTVHFVINNHIGFTTGPDEARSSDYPTDVAKIIGAPIFHVNGDDPEAMVFVTELALRFRQSFGSDVVIDMNCYRRHGHNEGDEPAYTQPVMYRRIKSLPTVRQIYTRELIERGELKESEEERITEKFRSRLQRAFDHVREERPPFKIQAFDDLWAEYSAPYSDDPVETAVPRDLIQEVADAIFTVPEGFHLNPKLARIVQKKHETVRAGEAIDWALAEALAFGTLLVEGTPVRLSGQDSARGTFSQRHSVWVDTESQTSHTPLNGIRPGEQARFCVYNSSLSEAAVLGFDFGYSLSEPRMLILWEAQFGDFANGAQVIVDQFLVCSESKWGRTSGIVMLLPHGYEGQGPEHSNAYLERYLQACAENNIQVCNLSTPANYFHVLRRQMKRPFRRPLVIMAPKSLLRHPEAVSSEADLLRGSFQEVMPDSEPPGSPARRVVLCSGKVYYDFLAGRRKEAVNDVACIRIEQLYPFPEQRILEAVARHAEAREVVWLQEEPENRGAWSFMFPRLLRLFPDKTIRYAGRAPSASAATGSFQVHQSEQERIVAEALNGGHQLSVGVSSGSFDKGGE